MRLSLGNTSIINIFLIPEDEDHNSPFQGYLTSLFSDAFHSTLHKTLSYPMNALEVYMPQDELIRSRNEIASPSNFLINPRSLTQLLPFFKSHPFVVITCLDKELEYIKNLDFKFKYKPLVVGIEEGVDLDIKEFNIFKLDEFIISRLQEAMENNAFPSQVIDVINSRTQREKSLTKIEFPSRNHAVTSPNESVIRSVGYYFEHDEPIKFSKDKGEYINAILESSNNLLSIIKNESSGIKESSKSDLIVYSPSIYTHLYNFKSHFWNQLSRNLNNKKSREFIMSGVFKNPNYSGMNITLDNKDEFEKIMSNKAVQALMGTRQFELAYTTLAMNSLAIANNCPVIRLPNSLNFHSAKLRDLESLSMSSVERSKDKFNRKFKDLTTEMTSEIGNDLLSYISENSNSITLCTDSLVEWVSFDKIPLMFTHEISKVHTTPGNQLLKISTNFSRIHFNKSELLKVTVIRSFNENDPIKYMLEKSLNYYINIDKEINLNIIDVTSKAQLIECLKTVNTPILIFDCHGNHGGAEEHGWLQIGGDKVDTWELPTRGFAPPIIILSACLTSAIGGSHASVASGLLDLGAIAVLGTLLPVDAEKSAVFVGRIMLRLTGYLKALDQIGVDYITWRQFISNFFRMSFCTDILTELKNNYKIINEAQYKEIHINANLHINLGSTDWYEKITNDISKVTNITNEEVLEVISDIGFLETMNYSQIGRPENIIIELGKE